MTAQVPAERKVWHVVYVLCQWPFIIAGFVWWFAKDGFSLGKYAALDAQKKVEDNV